MVYFNGRDIALKDMPRSERRQYENHKQEENAAIRARQDEQRQRRQSERIDAYNKACDQCKQIAIKIEADREACVLLVESLGEDARRLVLGASHTTRDCEIANFDDASILLGLSAIQKKKILAAILSTHVVVPAVDIYRSNHDFHPPDAYNFYMRYHKEDGWSLWDFLIREGYAILNEGVVARIKEQVCNCPGVKIVATP